MSNETIIRNQKLHLIMLINWYVTGKTEQKSLATDTITKHKQSSDIKNSDEDGFDKTYGPWDSKLVSIGDARTCIWNEYLTVF